MLAAIVYRKLRPGFLDSGPAAFTHRASGDTIAILLIVVAIMCLSYFELEDSAFHAYTGFLLLVAAAIVAVTIIAVTARLGPTGAAEQERRLEQQQERREDREDR